MSLRLRFLHRFGDPSYLRLRFAFNFRNFCALHLISGTFGCPLSQCAGSGTPPRRTRGSRVSSNRFEHFISGTFFVKTLPAAASARSARTCMCGSLLLPRRARASSVRLFVFYYIPGALTCDVHLISGMFLLGSIQLDPFRSNYIHSRGNL